MSEININKTPSQIDTGEMSSLTETKGKTTTGTGVLQGLSKVGLSGLSELSQADAMTALNSVGTEKPTLAAPNPAAKKKLSSDEAFKELLKEIMALLLTISDTHFKGDMLALEGFKVAMEGKFNEMEKAKDEAFKKACVSAGISFAQGAVSLGSAANSFVAAGRMTNASQSISGGAGKVKMDAGATGKSMQQTPLDVAKTPSNLDANVNKISQQATAVNSGLQGVTSALDGVDKIVGGIFDKRKAEADIKSQKHEADVTMWKASMESAEKYMNSMIQMLSTLVSTLEEARRNQASTLQHIATA